jgi:hypothetical protein
LVPPLRHQQGVALEALGLGRQLARSERPHPLPQEDYLGLPPLPSPVDSLALQQPLLSAGVVEVRK